MAASSTSGQGRPVGAKNKATAEVKELAGSYAPAALKELARLAVGAESETARVAACKEILDRAYGKAAQYVDVTHGGEITHTSAALSVIDDLFESAARERADSCNPDPLPN